MKWQHHYKILLSVLFPFLFILIISAICYRYLRRKKIQIRKESLSENDDSEYEEREEEELMGFSGGEHFTIKDILDAPGEVVGKSSYETFYRARIKTSSDGDGFSAVLLRFVRPICIGRCEEIRPPVRMIGLVRHPNMVPLLSLYVGPRGEKLFVYPFYTSGNLAQFLKGKSPDSKLSNRWETIYCISLGIAKGLNHLHSALQNPLIHGNLKSKNVMLDYSLHPLLSDFGLHLLLRPAAAQKMFEALAMEGYKAPELIKMREATMETDIYSLGIIFLEMLTHKEAANCRLLVLNQKMSDVFSSELISDREDRSSMMEGLLRRFYQLAMACCSPLPSLRPDIRQVIRKLEEIDQ